MRKLLPYLLVLCVLHSVAQNSKIDSLRNQYYSAKGDSSKAKLSFEIAYAYIDFNLDSGLRWSTNTIELAKKHSDYKYHSLGLLVKGHCIWRKGNYLKGLEAYNESLTIAEKNKLKEEEARALIGVGTVYNYLGDYPQSLAFYRKAQAVAESSSNERILGGLYSNIAGIYNNLYDYEQALEYRKKALQSSTGVNQDRLPASLSNIGRLYADMGEYRKGLSYLFQSLKLSKTAICLQLYILENIGYTYFKLGKLDSAEFFLGKGIEGTKNCSEAIPHIDLLTSLGEVNMFSRKLDVAIQYLNEAYQMGNKLGAVRETARAAKRLSEAYEKSERYKDALEIFKKFQALSDSVYSLKKVTAFGKHEASIEFELIRKNQEMSQRLEDLKKEEAIKNEIRLRNTFIVGFLIALVFAGLFFYFYRRRKRYSIELEQLNHEVHEQKEELVQLNNTLNSLNNELEIKVGLRTQELVEANHKLKDKNIKLEEYAFFNSHKLRSPVSSILGLVQLFNNANATETERQDFVNKIKTSTDKLDAIVREIQTIVHPDDSK
jgi:tetratricopeptide (TPR) repeat protein